MSNRSALIEMPIASTLQQQINELAYRNDFFRFVAHKIRTFEHFKGRKMIASSLSDDPDIQVVIPSLVQMYNKSHKEFDSVYGYNHVMVEEVGCVLQQARDYDQLCIDMQATFV